MTLMKTLRFALSAAALSLVPGVLGAQAPSAGADSIMRRALGYYCENRGMFDYLLGEWEWTGTRQGAAGKVSKIRGKWGATKSADGPMVTDEFRIINDAGATTYVSTTVRTLNPLDHNWSLVSLEPMSGIVQKGTAWKEGNRIRVDQTFTSGEGTSAQWRISYFDIGRDQFSWSADRSTDRGATWTKEFMTISARRTAAPREPASMLRADPLVLPPCK